MWRPVLWGGRPQWRLSEAWSLPRALLGAATEAKKAVLLVLALLEVVLKSGPADGRKETASDAGLPGPESLSAMTGNPSSSGHPGGAG